MEQEGWLLDETYYYIEDGCVLVPVGNDTRDYQLDDGTFGLCTTKK